MRLAEYELESTRSLVAAIPDGSN